MNNTLTEEELKELKRKAFEVISHARHILLSKYPFIGSIALRMDLVPTRDLRCRTACTDGNTVYFDIAFLSSLSNDERIFVLAHEVWHAVLMHLTRRGTRNPSLFNIATDKEVNYMLKEDGLIPPQHLCFPEGKEVGKCAEEIYEMLLKEQKQQMKQNGNNGQIGEMSGSSSSSSSSSSNSGSKQKSKNNNNSSNNQNDESDDNQSGNKDGKLEGQFDKHIYDGDEQNNPNNSQNDNNQPNKNGNNGNGENDSQYTSKITDKYGEVGYDQDFQPTVKKGFADRMRETIVATAQRIEKMKGSIPSHIKELVKRCTATELDWKELLAQFVTKCYNSGNRSWIPPNRRHIHNDIYLQSRQATKIKICVGIDTSGSTYGDRTKFLGELNGLIRSFGRFDLTIVECDAQVGDVKHYTQDDDLEHEIENNEYTMSGGGGTAMLPIYDYILDHQIECDAICIMTDGYIDNIPTNPIPSIPTLWVITKNGTEEFCNWGQKIKLKFDDEDL